MVGRRRLRGGFCLEGVGVHLGEFARLTVEPAAWGAGLAFVGPGGRLPVHLNHARPEAGATVLVGPAGTVGTPEHLLAALVGRGITDAELHLDGPEVPILDGSALPWWTAIAAAGVEQGPAIAARVVRRVHELSAFGGTARLEPAEGAEVVITVGWDDPGLPRGTLALSVEAFASVAAARTFVLVEEIARARAAGRGRGANAENTVVIGSETATNLRFPDEVLRHKVLDAIGDLALVGAPFRGRLVVDRGSHRLHAAILASWREEDPGCWSA